MPNRTSAILELMRRESLRPDQIVKREVINPDDDPNDWVNKNEAGWQPGAWVDGDLVDAIYKKLYADLREQDKHLEANAGQVFRQAYERAQEMEQALAAARQDQPDETAAVQPEANKEVMLT